MKGKHNNGSADHHSENEDNSAPETTTIINCVLNAPLIPISILGNALVLAAIIRTPSIRSTHMIMLCSLAVSDLLVGLFAQPIFMAEKLTGDRFVYHVSITMGYSLCGVSLLTITAITVDRFLALHYHMRYATLVTESRVKYTLIIIWLISFLESGIYFLNIRLRSLLTSIITITCLLICTFSFIRIHRIVRRHQLQIYLQQNALQGLQGSNTGNNFNITRLKKSALNTFVFYIALNICYLPLYVSLTLYGLSIMDWKTEWQFSYAAVFMNSSINPFLYCWRLRELRTAVVKTAKTMLWQQTDEN